ncbi:MAG: hypothetical protein JW772_03035 [Candidatus Diapherotrites archaeon]|nr:hypothetical protein [Candidatus Diapherotrites archaeon]
MQVSDVAIGLLLLFLFAWVMMIALNQNNHAIAINYLAMQGKVIVSDNEYCLDTYKSMQLVQKNDLRFKEYVIIPAATDSDELVLCIYDPLEG